MYDFVHLPTEIRAYRLERDKWIETTDGRRLARAGDWHAFGVDDVEYVIRHSVFEQSYEPKNKRDGDYYVRVTQDF